MSRFYGFTLFIIMATSLTACSFSLAGDIAPPPGSELPATQSVTQATSASPVYPIVPPDIVNGANLYIQQCTQCHGVNGLGDGPQAAQLSVPVATLGLSDFARQFSPAEWYQVVTQGNMEKFMPAFPKLTDRQRWDVVAYAMSLSVPEKVISQGKALFEDKCVRCHGQSGNGNGLDAATLSIQPKDFTDQAFMAQNSIASLYQAITNGVPPDMPAYTEALDDNQRWALASYLRTLTFALPQSVGNAFSTPKTSASVITSTANPGSEAYPQPAITQSPVLSATAEVTPTEPFLGTVTVQLLNGSGGDPPSDAPVTLYGFDNMQNTYSETLSSGVDGVYTFTNVSMPLNRVFLAGIDFDSGTYGSDIVNVDQSTPNLNLQITVYNSTTDLSSLTTDRVHILFDFTDPKNAQVIEVFIISNPTNEAIVSPAQDGTVVTFPLPNGYTNLQFQDGDLGGRYVEVAQGFADKMTVSPGVGQYQVIFYFQMPYDHKLEFVQPMFLPTSAVVIMVPDNGIKVTSNQLQDGGTRDFQNNTYRMYNGSGLLAGSSLEFTLSGAPNNGSTSIFTTGTMQNLAIGLGVFGIALVAGGLWLFRRNQKRLALSSVTTSSDLIDSPSGVDASSTDIDTLMDAIIALDDQYHTGNLPEEAYLQRRAALKDKLRKLEQG
jgi:mono/diheme cytochrome c family protein